jgi:hypothetical protein
VRLVSIRALRWVYGIVDPDLTATQKSVLACLAWHANPDDECWPKQRTLARECSMNETTVRRALSELDGRYIDRQRQNRADGSRRNDHYWLYIPGAAHGRPRGDQPGAPPGPTVTRPWEASARTGTHYGPEPTSEPTTSSTAGGRARGAEEAEVKVVETRRRTR